MPCRFQAGAEQQLRPRCGALRPVSLGPRQPLATALCTEASCPAPTLDPRSPPPAGVHRRPRCPHSKARVPTTPAAVTLVTNHGPAPASAGRSTSRRATQQHRLLQGRRPSPGRPEPHARQHLEEGSHTRMDDAMQGTSSHALGTAQSLRSGEGNGGSGPRGLGSGTPAGQSAGDARGRACGGGVGMGEGGGLGMRRGPFLGHRRLLPLHARGRQRWPERCREGGVAGAAAGDCPSRPVGKSKL
jgi:hypothetical protein